MIKIKPPIQCPRCNQMTKPDNFCQHCGAPVGLGRAKPAGKWTPAQIRFITAIIGVAVVIVAIGLLVKIVNEPPVAPRSSGSTSTPSQPPTYSTPTQPARAKINATVKFDGKQFFITNKNSYDWSDVTMEVNDRFELKTSTVKAGTTYTVGGLQFADSDGIRFNPFQLKAKEFSICIRLPQIDCYVGGWE